jgi:hypothetical protein
MERSMQQAKQARKEEEEEEQEASNIKEQGRDYVFSLLISEFELAEGKRPPLCDGCARPFPTWQQNQYAVESTYLVNCLILDGERFHSLQCDECIDRYFKNLERLDEIKVQSEVIETVKFVLSKEMGVIVFPDIS